MTTPSAAYTSLVQLFQIVLVSYFSQFPNLRNLMPSHLSEALHMLNASPSRTSYAAEPDWTMLHPNNTYFIG